MCNIGLMYWNNWIKINFILIIIISIFSIFPFDKFNSKWFKKVQELERLLVAGLPFFFFFLAAGGALLFGAGRFEAEPSLFATALLLGPAPSAAFRVVYAGLTRRCALQ